MEILSSSGSWIIALGKTLVNSLWLGLLLLSLLRMIYLVIPQRYPGLRYNAALLILFSFAGLTIGLFLYLYSPVQEVLSISPPGIPVRKVNSLMNFDNFPGDRPLYHYISLVYIAGIAVVLGKTILDLGKVRGLRQEANSINGSWTKLFLELKVKAGIRRSVDFLVSESTSIPFLTGILKPAIIIPAAMLSQLSVREVEAIVMHEFYHLKRLDNLMNLLQKLLEMVFFFNPAIWVLAEMISCEREKRCDDLVLKSNSHPLDYARALYHLSVQQANPDYLVSAATGKGQGELKGRIERILKPDNMKKNRFEKTNALLIFIAGVALMILISGFTSGLSIPRYQNVPEETPQESPRIHQIVSDTLTEEEKQKIQEEVKKALEEIDLEEIRRDMQEALAEINLEQLKKDIEEARHSIEVEIDWEEMKKDLEEAKREALTEIDLEAIKKDLEEAKQSIQVEVDWEEIKREMDEVKVKIELMMEDLDLDMDIDIDVDSDTLIDKKG